MQLENVPELPQDNEPTLVLSPDGTCWELALGLTEEVDHGYDFGRLARAVYLLSDGYLRLRNFDVPDGQITAKVISVSGDASIPAMSVLNYARDGISYIAIRTTPLDMAFFDMDGVTFDWAEFIKRHLGIDDIERLNKHPLHKELLRRVYLAYPDVFMNLNPIPQGAACVYDTLAQGIPVCGLSAVGEHHNFEHATTNKQFSWWTKFIDGAPNEVAHNAIIVRESADKAAYASPNHMLVDDYDKNVQAWQGPYVLWDMNDHDRSQRLCNAVMKMFRPRNFTVDGNGEFNYNHFFGKGNV